MTFKEGDIISIDDVNWEVDYTSPKGIWIKEPGKIVGYFGLRFESKEEIKKLSDAGRLCVGGKEKITGGTGECVFHAWRKYVGIREVYDYCLNCGAKKHKDWRLIKDETNY